MPYNPYATNPPEEKIQTFQINCDGGLILNKGSLQLAEEQPGAAINLVNMEIALLGGYRRVNGYVKYISAIVPDYVNVAGTPTPNPGNPNPVNGVCVFNGGIVAARGDYIYFALPGAGSWTRINPSNPFTNTTGVRFTRYNWATPALIITTGVTNPYKWDGTTLTQLTNAPANATGSVVYNGYLWVWGYASQRFSFSAPYAENDWSAVDGAGEFNMGRTIIGLKPFRDTLYIFCDHSISRLDGNSPLATASSPFQLTEIAHDIGCISYETIQEVGGDLIFLSQDGLRPISGTNRIGDVQLATISSPVYNYIYSNLSQSRFIGMIVHAKTQYRLFFNSSSNTQINGVGVIGCLRQNGWEFGKLLGFNPYCGDSYYINNAEYVVHGDYNGYVYQQEVGYNFDGNNIPSIYQTPPITFNDPSFRKTVYKTRLFNEYEGQYSLILGVILDQSKPGIPQPNNIILMDTSGSVSYGITRYGSGMYGNYPSNESDTNVIGSGFTIGFTFVTNDQNPSHTFKSITIDYSVLGRQ